MVDEDPGRSSSNSPSCHGSVLRRRHRRGCIAFTYQFHLSVAVLAFKAAYGLLESRRENDKRIISLYVEMKDMISILVQSVMVSFTPENILTCYCVVG